VRVWNRRQARADPLRAKGGAVARSPRDAVAGAGVVLTVLFDTDAVIEVMTATLGSLPTPSIWGS
jgi:3-hydroxyisobutyrate dehydrogenase